MVQEKALEFATLLSVKDFTASNGWLDRFKKRKNLDFKNVVGEGGDIGVKVVQNWTKNDHLQFSKTTLEMTFIMWTRADFSITCNQTSPFIFEVSVASEENNPKSDSRFFAAPICPEMIR